MDGEGGYPPRNKTAEEQNDSNTPTINTRGIVLLLAL